MKKTMSEILLEKWTQFHQDMRKGYWYSVMESGDFRLKHYKAFLRETYFHAGMNPQLQAAATLYFSGRPRKLVKKFYQHAIAEIGHDLLALDDLKALGEPTESIVNERPLPNTTALIAFPFYEMQMGNPLSYLGYLYHLEFMPTQAGKSYIEQFIKLGVPQSALTFIEEHAVLDLAHNKMMNFYIDELVKTPDDLEAVLYGAKATADLHGNMISGAFREADAGLFESEPKKLAA